MISFAFDDVPASAAETGAAILEARGLKGTYFVAAALAGADAVTGPMADRGRCAGAWRTPATRSAATPTPTSTAVRPPPAMRWRTSRATPRRSQAWGVARPDHLRLPVRRRRAGDQARARRALWPDARAAPRPHRRPAATSTRRPRWASKARTAKRWRWRWLERAARRQAWLILYTHDVADQPSPYGCTPAALERLADAALANGFEVVTIAEGAARLG